MVSIAVALSARTFCSSGMKVKPHGLLPFVLYFNRTKIRSLRVKKGGL